MACGRAAFGSGERGAELTTTRFMWEQESAEDGGRIEREEEKGDGTGGVRRR